MNNRTVTLDVRPDLRNGAEPFSKIMRTVAALGPGDNLLLIAPFEPVPLFQLLANQGFNHSSRQNGEGDWEVLFVRGAAPTATAPVKSAAKSSTAASNGNASVELDARGLEPPQPLVRILEALSALPDGAALRARTDRRPMHLYAQLEARGFAGTTKELEDGSYLTHIVRG